MGLLTSIKNWLNKKPSKDDLFFTHIREAYQNIKVLINDEQLVKIFCLSIYVTSILLLCLDYFTDNKISVLSVAMFCISMAILICRCTVLAIKDDDVSFL